ncbi:16S rRNA (cytosine967-C5)-methyltransferase [Pseudorhodobacter antarcticus]|jgi:16S rRNA (cytosine967-C5)-methyltransferase|uniref:16S rRNA (Cytosine967-C5)-methyltransferase n=1 Tax=Pseudorhodobacter antarcticus TaxID=1077947 RepID=A0A1H8FKZ2_9RHOB|nr:transcription antitermination factor NusB [Pseudorhodobacter antarcticus]SEN31837.1 16S rRNA (cytosine967-C5)-methyltransferase [Pseudorhodobacter antarcticus]
MAVDGTTARNAAVTLLGAVLDEGAQLSQALDAPDSPIAPLSPSDRARAQRLVLTTLRHIEQADRVLAPYLRKSPPDFVRNALRLAVVEMAVDGGAAHGVVNAMVDIVRHGNRTGHMTGLVNAVLRKVAATPDPFVKLPPQRMPQWLRQPLVHRWGRDVVAAIEAVQAQAPPLDLTPKTSVEIEGAVALPTGSLRIGQSVQVSALPGFATGDWWVQDAGAAMAARLLDAQKGEVVLDLCAAPGGKTLQLAATGAKVTAVDISSPRLARLHENLARTGLTASIIATDALHWEPGYLFDAVLLDAPCSATGTLRRHPDLPFSKDGSDVPQLVALQAALIDRALGFLKPGGRLVFCTCSLLAEEGEDQLTATLARHPALTVEPPTLQGIDPAWITPDGGLRLRPDYWADIGGIDGFFMARLRTPAA